MVSQARPFRRKIFSSYFIGPEVNFTSPNPSSWTLVRKTSERNDQYNEYMYWTNNGPSTTWAFFQCRDRSNSNNLAIMKIYMQLASS